MWTSDAQGYEFHNDQFIVFFGNKDCDIEFLKKRYPEVQFRSIKQTHSDILVKSEYRSENIEADAHWTSDISAGLVIKTADCIPIMIYDHKNKSCLAIHAGWKGVENQISLKALKNIQASQNLSVYLGPCIQQKSFEVDEDVFRLLEKSSFVKDDSIYYYKKDKYWVDLLAIVKSQILNYAPEAKIYQLSLDTFTDTQFNSYRRNKTTFRNLSFISLKSSK